MSSLSWINIRLFGLKLHAGAHVRPSHRSLTPSVFSSVLLRPYFVYVSIYMPKQEELQINRLYTMVQKSGHLPSGHLRLQSCINA
jgi:hypothetical protein